MDMKNFAFQRSANGQYKDYQKKNNVKSFISVLFKCYDNGEKISDFKSEFQFTSKKNT